MKILIGVDDSPHARAAVERVGLLTWPKGTQVIVCSVVRPAINAYAEVYAPQAAFNEELVREQWRYHEQIAGDAERELGGRDLTIEKKVLEGDPRVALVDLARAEHADLLVVGSHGRTGLARLVLGSVAGYVVSHAPCDVLVVRRAES